MGSLYNTSSPWRRGLLAAALFTCAAYAQENVVQRAQELLRAGEASAAYQLLGAQEAQLAGDPDFDLNFAIAANEVGQFPRAIQALERLLIREPSNERARVEMGRALYGVGDNRAARALLNEGKLKGFVSVAGDTIDQLLHAIDRVESEGKSSYKGFVELAAGHDSNLNSAPGLTSVAVPAFSGSIVTVNPAGARGSGNFLAAGTGLSGRYILDPRWSLIGTGIAKAQFQSPSVAQLDYNQFDANGGVSYRVERHEYTLVAQVGTYDIDYMRTRNSYGAVAEWTYRFDGFRQFNAYVQLGNLEYPQNHVSDVRRQVIGMTYAHLTRGGIWSYGGLYYGREKPMDAGLPYLGHHVGGIRAGIQFPLSASVGGFFNAGFEQREFGGVDPLFLYSRNDMQYNFTAGLSWVPDFQWRVTPQWTIVHTHSNVPLAQYDKRTFSVAVRREF